MSASRLPGKPLLRINNLPIISHVVNRAKKSNIGRVVVCTEDEEILKEVKNNGGEAILTSSKHKSGSDRIFEAFTKLKINNVDYVLNLQGDEPNIDENDIINLNKFMIQKNSDIGTLATKIKDTSILSDENVVKVVLKEKLSLGFSEDVDLASQKERILQKIESIKRQVDDLNNKLKNKAYIKNAPKEIVQNDKKLVKELTVEDGKLRSIVSSIN